LPEGGPTRDDSSGSAKRSRPRLSCSGMLKRGSSTRADDLGVKGPAVDWQPARHNMPKISIWRIFTIPRVNPP
jgi:hypothetical protein